MVRRRRTSRPKPKRPSNTMRQLHRSVAFEPTTNRRIPNDPPSLKNTFLHTTTLPFVVVLGSSAGVTGGVVTNTITCSFAAASTTTSATITAYPVTPADLYRAWQTFTRHESLSTVSTIALKKATFWGISHPSLSAVRIGLRLIQNLPFSSRSVTDVGSTNARSKVSLSCPYNAWLDCTSTTNLLVVDPDASMSLGGLIAAAGLAGLASGQIVGELHVTVSVRITSAV